LAFVNDHPNGATMTAVMAQIQSDQKGVDTFGIMPFHLLFSVLLFSDFKVVGFGVFGPWGAR
jgi:hypothetical protein